MVQSQAENLLPQRTDKADLYFVGFAADSSIGVFRKEVTYSQQLFDDKFGTEGRSVALINSSQTSDQLPMATAENLDATLKAVGKIIDPEQDVVFLFLTGHGAYSQGVVTDYWPHHQGLIEPKMLKESLNQAGIKWKVVVVSACFSGQFADELADLYTLVITASNPNQPSFGCTSGADFTYFGEAFFKDQLTQTTNFEEAFLLAKAAITERENNMGFDNSYPTMRTTKRISDKLNALFSQP
ncbi:C13 family peptidase [Vibrio sp. IRLE0018]|uniref:C13 family peptidase n=1 Tax=Vibrio TaxID=662 RepID=UPI001F45A796|nr:MULTISPECIES: C13 family peptidase [Vibrio]MCF8778052.1 C13 family peptidase [Vibrio floridensis]